MKNRKNSFVIMLVILISSICTVPVFAAEEVKTGTIEIRAEKEMKFEYAKIGEIEDGNYVLKKEYKKSGVNLNHLKHAEDIERAAKKLSPYMKVEGNILTDREGKAKLENLSQGIYLIRYSKVSVLVTIPTWDEKQQNFIYDITVIPKLEEPEAPQTALYSPFKIYIVIAMGLFMCAAMFSYKAQKEYRPYKVSSENREKLRAAVVEVEANDPLLRKIDFEKLKEENSEIYGWIYIPGTCIDDPILIGKTNTEYLHKNFLGERSALGAVFGFADMAKDFSDAHICLFGHNMRTGQMFGELKKYRNPEFIKAHKEIYIYTPDRVKKYQVFSVYDCDKADLTFDCKVEHRSPEVCGLRDYMYEKNQAGILLTEKEEMELLVAPEILTLASCSNYRETAERFTVNAALRHVKVVK